MKLGSNTQKIISIIGTPFENGTTNEHFSDSILLEMYEKAFYDRIAPLYLHKYRREGWLPKLENHFRFVKDRELMTLTVLSDLSEKLNNWNKNGYVIFKSIKPYPAIPNDTDVLIFGSRRDFNSALEYLYNCGYVFHEWAPMQTTLYDPRGRGKIGSGKKGGTYYIDIYHEISTDYVCYLSEEAIRPNVIVKQINGVDVRLLKQEPELAVILFHNIFPERTYNLEHFYMPLYHLADPKFDIDLFVRFTEENRLVYAVKTNFSLTEKLHREYFGFIPNEIKLLLKRWGRNDREVEAFINKGMETPYLLTPTTFWTACASKLGDNAFTKSLLIQGLHMLNPIFFLDVLMALKKRLGENGAYHME